VSDDDEPGLVKDEITLPDGRYLIYYTFPEEVVMPDSNVILSPSKDAPKP
jgi:hypothetical protein